MVGHSTELLQEEKTISVGVSATIWSLGLMRVSWPFPGCPCHNVLWKPIRTFDPRPHLDLRPSTRSRLYSRPSTKSPFLHFDLRPGRDGNLRPSTNLPLVDHVEPLTLTLISVTFMRNVYGRLTRFVLPLTARIVLDSVTPSNTRCR